MMRQAGGTPGLYWDYTMGMPEANGWTRVNGTGTSNATLTGTSLKCTNNKAYANGFVRYVSPDYSPVSSLEVSYELNENNSLVLVGLSVDGEHGCAVRAQYSTNNNGIYLVDASTFADMTKLKGIVTGQPCKIKIAIDNGYADVWLDDVQYVIHKDINELAACTLTRFQFSPTANLTKNGYFFSANLKLGST